MRSRRLRSATLLLIAFAGAATRQRRGPGTAFLGVTGSSPSEPTRNPTAILHPPEVQHLILDIAERPHTRAEIESATCRPVLHRGRHGGGGPPARRSRRIFWIDFNLLTGSGSTADPRGVRGLRDEDLATAFLERRGELEAIARRPRGSRATCQPSSSISSLGCVFRSTGTGSTLTEERGLAARRAAGDRWACVHPLGQGAGGGDLTPGTLLGEPQRLGRRGPRFTDLRRPSLTTQPPFRAAGSVVEQLDVVPGIRRARKGREGGGADARGLRARCHGRRGSSHDGAGEGGAGCRGAW